MSERDPELQRLFDREAISSVVIGWGRAADRLDFDLMRRLFHPDAIDEHGAFTGSVDELIEWVRARHRRIVFSMHQISNITVEFAADDRAVAESYVRTVQRYPAEAAEQLAQLTGGRVGAADKTVDLLTCSRYIDRFERRAGEWRIAHRLLIPDWKQLTEVPDGDPWSDPSNFVGSRDRQDPLYRVLEEMGL